MRSLARKEKVRYKHRRMQLFFKELRLYRIDLEYCYEVMEDFFHVGPQHITAILRDESLEGIEIRHLALDKMWIKQLVRDIKKR